MALTTELSNVYLEGCDKPITNLRYVSFIGNVPQIRGNKHPVTLMLDGSIRIGNRMRKDTSWAFGFTYMKRRLLPGQLLGLFDQQLSILCNYYKRFPEEQNRSVAREEEAVDRNILTVSLPGLRCGREEPNKSTYAFTKDTLCEAKLRGLAFSKATQHQKYLEEQSNLANYAYNAASEIRDWAYAWLECSVPRPVHPRQSACVNFTDFGYSTVFRATPSDVDLGFRWSWSDGGPVVVQLVHYNNPKLTAELLLWGCSTT